MAINEPTATQKGGRPSLFSAQATKRVADALRLGATYKMAAQYGGISYDTMNDWMNKGKKAQTLVSSGQEITPDLEQFYNFYQELQKAESDAVLGWLAKIEREANEGNWQAAAWKLERRYPRDYSRNVTEVVGEEGGPVKVHFYLPDNGRNRIGAPQPQIETAEAADLLEAEDREADGMEDAY